VIAVRLHGPLAEKYGGEHRFDVQTPREAVWALAANHDGFQRDFLAGERWAFLVDGDWRHGDDTVNFPVSREIDICPMVEGRAFIGAAFIGFLIPSIAGTAAASMLGGLLVAGLLLGVSMLFSPKAPKPASSDEKKNENYSFSGPANITTQGAPVPVAYGRVHVGSIVVSAGLQLGEEFNIIPPPEPGTGTPPPPPVAWVYPGGNPDIVAHNISESKTVQGPRGWRYSYQTTERKSDDDGQTYTTTVVYGFQSPVKVQPPSPLQFWLWDISRGFRPGITGGA
jgi:predicted phage tail protein